MPLRKPDLPEPEWWQHARYLEQCGISRYRIHKTLNVAYSAVRYALDPAYRAATKAKTLEWQRARPDRAKNYHCNKRNHLRRTVREVWREAGCKRSLEEMYLEAGCGSKRANGPCARSNRP